jgi:hypothetical protein
MIPKSLYFVSILVRSPENSKGTRFLHRAFSTFSHCCTTSECHFQWHQLSGVVHNATISGCGDISLAILLALQSRFVLPSLLQGRMVLHLLLSHRRPTLWLVRSMKVEFVMDLTSLSSTQLMWEHGTRLHQPNSHAVYFSTLELVGSI